MEKPYFTTIVAFSTPSGRLHIGHALGQVAGDVAARYAELNGKKPYIPFGIHATGKDLIRILDEISPANPKHAEKRAAYGLNEQTARQILSEENQTQRVQTLINHYRVNYASNLADLGVSVDPDSFFSTDEPAFHKYTQWALRKLNDRGLIVKTTSPRPYCLTCKDIKAIERDFSEVSPVGKVNLEDVRIQEGNLLFFYEGNTIFPVYTTRPETVFGATNLFFNPSKKYFEVTVNDRKIVSEEEGLEYLVASLFKESKIQSIAPVGSLERRRVVSPFTHDSLPLVPASFVKSDTGTGMVMSVPMHDPFDYFFLANGKKELLSNAKAVIVDENSRPISFDQTALNESALESVREQTYANQENGRMVQNIGKYSSLAVPMARETLLRDSKSQGNGGKLFRLMGGTFLCRSHKNQKITINLTEENSIDYGNSEFQERTISLSQNLKLFPPKYGAELAGILRSRRAKPCERNLEGNIGTPSPFDATKRIEALSDSNVYMEYYAIARALNRGKLKPEQLNDALFDYLFLGSGSADEVAERSGISPESLAKSKNSIFERYPVDLNIAASEHKDVHFPFSLFTHAAILPRDIFPKEYLLTSLITRNGEKMSKSKGNVLHIDDLVTFVRKNPIRGISEESSLDAIRYFLMSYQSLDNDFDWSEKEFINSGLNRLRKYAESTVKTASGRSFDFEIDTPQDKWFSTKLQRATTDAKALIEERRFRDATIKIDEFDKNIGIYHSIPGSKQGFVNKALETSLTLMYPFTPRLSEELGNRLFGRFERIVPQSDPALEFPEEHDKTETELSGKRYIAFLAGSLKRSLGIARGRKIDKSGAIKILFPSNFSLELLRNDPSLRVLIEPHEIVVDPRIRTPAIKYQQQIL